MSHNRRIFIEALDRSESRRDGGYKQNWSFSLSGDNEEERRHDTSVVTMEEVDRQQQSSSPEGNKSPTLRHFSSSDPLRTYENRPNNHSRSLNKLGSGRRLSEISQTVATPSPMPNRTNYFIVSPPSQGVVLQGRAFQHSHINPAIKKHVQRNDFLTTQQIPPVQLDSIVLTCPEISDDENVSIKRRAQHKRRSSQESCCSFPSPVKPVEPLRSDSHLTMCCKCNQPSEDHSKCHRCGNVLSFQHAFEAQLSSPAARPPNRSQPSTGPSNLQLSKNFYSPASTMRAPRMEILPVRVTKTSFPAPHNGRPGTGLAAGTSSCCGSRVSTKGKRTAAAKQHELNDPIVLSSDDDEEADTASTGSVNRLDSVSPRPADSAHSSPAPSGGRVEAAVKSTGELDITADFFSDVDTKISLPRRPRMKDPVCLCGKPVPESFSPKNKKPKVSTAKCDSIILECRSIRVGTLRRMVTKPVVFSIENIQLETEAPQQMEDVSLRASELISCEWCSVRKLPVLFFQTTQAECLRLRTQLNMTQEKGNMWYDCAGNQSDEKYIVLIFENGLTMKDQMILEDILKEIGCTNNLEDFPTKLSFDEANSRLVNYNKATKEKEEKRKPTPSKITQVSPVKPVLTVAPTTQVAQVTQVSPVSPVLLPVRTRMATRQHSSTFLNEEDDDMAELHPTFTGPIVKLMVYPPPPAKGGISVTNEDLHCLNEGEFLNDVIIDFYLKYLVLEKLKKEDAQRSHVFSSFFYKRLNQREKRPVPDTANLPIQIRKHNRVKTWTRHVDLFQKDFIFVPINESAHWYLAVICFPGLQGPHYEDNSMYQGQTLAPGSVPGVDPALGPPMEDSFPDHCRPISPDTDDAPGPQKHLSPCGTGSSLEGHFSTDRTNVYSACANEVQEPSNAPSAKMNAQGDNLPQYTNGLHRICLSYGSGNDDSFTFPDDQSSCQDECSEDGALADETLSPDSSGWTSKPTVCKQPCILIMDSLRGPGRSAVVKTLREYLEVEWETRKGSQRRFGKEVMKGSNPRVPQQDNFSDCGVYVLQYVESFFENPIPSFQLPVNLTEWFPQQRMKTKREEITELILQLQTQQEVDKKETNEGSAACSPGEPEIEETSGSGVQNLHVSP